MPEMRTRKVLLENFGTGTQRVEEVAAKIFPDYKIQRLDSDSLSKKKRALLKIFREFFKR